MLFHNPLRQAVLIKRYKRFLADVELENGEVVTVHCPNTGAMTGCAEAGMRVWLSDSANSKRKYRFTWEIAETFKGQLICVNTHRANRVAGEALDSNVIEQLTELQQLSAERKYGYDNRRIDWFARDSQHREVYIEVKSVTLADANQGYFPDTVSKRASDHLRSLQDMVADGHRAVVLYTVLHSGIENVSAARHIDPKYAEECQKASKAGVEFYALGCELTLQAITPRRELPVMI
ncbi:DNA/RNA nuclease SfsA [Pseudidiomarina marina]|uniref:DNA/RNA nuclease SfsA n=1 Tax=Pseudidiomarina marina TaxID=502366 RepID=UPI00384ACF5B